MMKRTIEWRCSVMADYDAEAALIVTDVQNDFADPAGSLYVRDGELVVPVANREIARALRTGAVVVYTQDWHPPSTPHFKKDGGIWPVHCVQGTWGAEFHPDLDVVDGGEVLRKGGRGDGYSAFSVRDPVSGERGETKLAGLLGRRNVRRLVVLGLATDYCVRETVLDAARLGFGATVVEEGIRAVDLRPGDGPEAILAMAAAGARVE